MMLQEYFAPELINCAYGPQVHNGLSSSSIKSNLLIAYFQTG